MQKLSINTCILILLFLFFSCSKGVKQQKNDSNPEPTVSITHPILGSIQNQKQINGQISYLNKTKIYAPISGYVINVNTNIGNKVNKGDLLFKIQTMESQALQDSKDLSSNQIGVVPIYSNITGTINSLLITDPNVYVAKGNTMATIVKNEDMVIQANVLYEDQQSLITSKQITVELPDKTIFPATYYKRLPDVEPISQTQPILLKLKNYKPLPENLNVNVKFLTNKKINALLLPKEAVLTNETQNKFWVFKLTIDSIAVKVPITKGLSNNTKTEIINSGLNVFDNIIVKGAYGLPDSIKVKIVK